VAAGQPPPHDGPPSSAPDPSLPGPSLTRPPAPHEGRGGLAELSPDVADRVRFDRAAPRRLRSSALPIEARQLFEHLWDDIVADIHQEVAGLRRTRLIDRQVVTRVLERVATRVQQAERALIVTAVYRPVPSDREWKHVAMGGVSGATTAVAEGMAAYATLGTGATVAIASAVVGELFETYVAASGRVLQYRRAGRSPAPDLVVADLAESIGLKAAAGRRASLDLSRQALRWLDDRLVARTGRRFSRGLVPVLGVAAGAGLSGTGVRRVLKLPLRPPSEEELLRLARDVVDDGPRSRGEGDGLAGAVPLPRGSGADG
jgi:hypothetical protein